MFYRLVSDFLFSPTIFKQCGVCDTPAGYFYDATFRQCTKCDEADQKVWGSVTLVFVYVFLFFLLVGTFVGQYVYFQRKNPDFKMHPSLKKAFNKMSTIVKHCKELYLKLKTKIKILAVFAQSRFLDDSDLCCCNSNIVGMLLHSDSLLFAVLLYSRRLHWK